jgi:thiamine-monophosphate kinase
MIDVSDGLGADLGHLLAASGVGARVAVSRIPVLASAREAARERGEAAWHFAARSGEEYELLAALPADVTDAALGAGPVPLTAIGAIEAERGARAFEDDRPVALPSGWDHFRGG